MNKNVDDYKDKTGYTCSVCGYATKYKNDFRRHLNKKIPCITDTVNLNSFKNNNLNIAIDNSFNYTINTIKPSDDLMETLKIELEKIKVENEYLNNQNTVLKTENEILKNEIVELKNERKELFFLFKSQSPPQPPQPVQPPQPQIIQIVQPAPEPPKPKEIIRKDKPAHYRELYKDCLVLNDYISNMEYHPEDLYSIHNAIGDDFRHKYINGIAKLFIKKIHKINTETDRPIFCTDKSLHTIHFKYIDREPKYKMVAYGWDELYKKYKDEITNDEIDVDSLEQNEWGEYLMKEIDTDCNEKTEWIKESGSNYPIFTKIMFNFHAKLTKFLTPKNTKEVKGIVESEYNTYLIDTLKMNNTTDMWMETKNVMYSTMIKDDIEKIVALICKGIYVE